MLIAANYKPLHPHVYTLKVNLSILQSLPRLSVAIQFYHQSFIKSLGGGGGAYLISGFIGGGLFREGGLIELLQYSHSTMLLSFN